VGPRAGLDTVVNGTKQRFISLMSESKVHGLDFLLSVPADTKR